MKQAIPMDRSKEARECSVEQSIADGTSFRHPQNQSCLLSRILHIATNPGDLVLDSFLGSGTTAAVAHKMGRRWIGIEMGDHAVTHCLPRLQKVVDGEQGGISAAVNWQGGGGFQLDATRVRRCSMPQTATSIPDVRFADLAAFIWMRETGTAYEPAAPPVAPCRCWACTRARAYYLLFNGILGDRRPASRQCADQRRAGTPCKASCWHDGPKVVYGEACLPGRRTAGRRGITFRKLPHAVPR
jgi:adenine-specific DNA-methyltransferase